ncbi:MAG: hypothetical protein F6K39_39460, partial [Okeania sp. SIO3B3]|nr:hypothetical protein [Okeania sp. SIO3B3]
MINLCYKYLGCCLGVNPPLTPPWRAGSIYCHAIEKGSGGVGEWGSRVNLLSRDQKIVSFEISYILLGLVNQKYRVVNILLRSHGVFHFNAPAVPLIKDNGTNHPLLDGHNIPHGIPLSDDLTAVG